MSQNHQIPAEHRPEAFPMSITLPTSYTPPHSPRVEAGPSKVPIATPLCPPYNDLTPEEEQAQDLEGSIALQEAQTQIIVEPEEPYEESDAGYETNSTYSGSQSVTSLTRDYVFENGLRYHRYREGAYNFSNAASEQHREHQKHLMMESLCQGRRFHAPIGSNPQNILDLGTGTGEWAIEIADIFPSAQVIGVDLSPIQTSWVPPNLQFMIDDIEEEWLRPENHFDFIHTRHLVMAIKDWPRLLQQALLHLKPGGWMELQEVHHFPEFLDGSNLQLPHEIAKYWTLVYEALGVLGVDFHVTKFLAGMMTEAGFVNVQQRIYYVPLGDWHPQADLKEAGRYWKDVLVQGLEPIATGTLTRGLNWTKEAVDEMIVPVRHAYFNNCPKVCMPVHCIYGQKAESRKRKASDECRDFD